MALQDGSQQKAALGTSVVTQGWHRHQLWPRPESVRMRAFGAQRASAPTQISACTRSLSQVTACMHRREVWGWKWEHWRAPSHRIQQPAAHRAAWCLLPAHSPASSRAQPALLWVTKDVGTLLAAEPARPFVQPSPAELPPPSLCILMPAPFFALTGVYHISLVGILPSLA